MAALSKLINGGFPPSMQIWRDVGGWLVGRHPEVARRARKDGVWPDRTVAELAAERADAAPDKVLIVDGDRALRSADLFDMAMRLATRLSSMGVAAGDVVSFQLPNWWEATVVNLAAAMIGAVVNPIVPINRDGELIQMLGMARSKLIFIPHLYRGFDYAAMMRRVAQRLTTPPRVVVLRGEVEIDDVIDFAELVSEGERTAPKHVDPDAVKLLMYTSGTTGRPKAVLHSHNSIHADGVYMRNAMALRPGDAVFCPTPLTHISGYLWVLNQPWLSGIPAYSIDQWQGDRGFQLLRDKRCTVMIGATPFLQDIVAQVEAQGETLPALEHYVCGGAAVPSSLIYRAGEALPNCIPWRTFGATETATLTRGPRSRAEMAYGAETDGRVWSADIKIADLASGRPLPAGQEGELLVRGPGMMLGYVDPADNAAALDRDGFFRMGDLVRLTDDDHLICTGRVKDLIIRAGENISAKEIEDVLAAQSSIAEAAVVAKPSLRTGEAICAFLVMRAGAEITLPEIDAIFRETGLARQKTPEHLFIVDELPKTPAGKVRKDVLRRTAAET